VLSEFASKGIVLIPFAGIDGSYVFDREHEYAIKGTQAFYEGKIYLQSIASQFPALVLDPEAGESILDVCAAPGSKTTQLAMMMENRGSIYAIEQNQIRYDKLLHNCALQ
jgi:16S rRNA (cytosine1407-C5)-methyltransferase